jgi:chemotaxis protein MotA
MKQNQILLVSIVSGITYFFFWNIMATYFESGDIGRLVLLMGGSSLGFFQAISFTFLTFCVLDLYFKISEIKKQKTGFDKAVLPNHDSLVITPEEVNKIKLDIVYLEKNGLTNEINDFIKKACTQYRNENSVVETLHVLDSHVSNQKEVKESALENVCRLYRNTYRSVCSYWQILFVKNG